MEKFSFFNQALFPPLCCCDRAVDEKEEIGRITIQFPPSALLFSSIVVVVLLFLSFSALDRVFQERITALR